MPDKLPTFEAFGGPFDGSQIAVDLTLTRDGFVSVDSNGRVAFYKMGTRNKVKVLNYIASYRDMDTAMKANGLTPAEK